MRARHQGQRDVLRARQQRQMAMHLNQFDLNQFDNFVRYPHRKRRRLHKRVDTLIQEIDASIGGFLVLVSHNTMDFHPRLDSEVRHEIETFGDLWQLARGPLTSRAIMHAYRKDFRRTKFMKRIAVYIYRIALSTCRATGYISDRQYVKRRRSLARRNQAGSFLAPGWRF